MKVGISVQELYGIIEEEHKGKVDYLVGADAFRAVVDKEGIPILEIDGYGGFDITTHAHVQLANYAKIPYQYHDRLREEAADLLAYNLNYWFEHNKRTRMIRTIGNQVRAILSPRYRRLDNYNLLRAVLPGVEHLRATIASCALTDTRVYIKAVLPDLREEMGPVTFEPALIISNSEVGDGAVDFRMAIHTRPCANMVVWAQPALRQFGIDNRLWQRHLGPDLQLDPNERVRRLPSDSTQQGGEQVFWELVQETVERGAYVETFRTFVDKLKESRKFPMSSREQAERVVERLRRLKSFSQPEADGILRHLFEDGDLSKFGLSNAITRFSQDVESYDRASFFERVGGEIIAMSDTRWRRLN